MCNPYYYGLYDSYNGYYPDESYIWSEDYWDGYEDGYGYWNWDYYYGDWK